jgi:hypothetical protein
LDRATYDMVMSNAILRRLVVDPTSEVKQSGVEASRSGAGCRTKGQLAMRCRGDDRDGPGWRWQLQVEGLRQALSLSCLP